MLSSPTAGFVAAENVLGVDGAEPRELHQLVGRAVDVGAGVEHDDRLARRRKNGGDRRPLEAGVQPSTTIDAAICAPVLPAETNASDSPSAWSLRPTIIELFGLPRTAAPGLSVISMTSGASTIDDALALRCAAARTARAQQERVELLGDDGGAADELDRVCGIELAQGEQRAGNGRLGSEVAPHGVQRDARQGYASLASTRCLPA